MKTRLPLAVLFVVSSFISNAQCASIDIWSQALCMPLPIEVNIQIQNICPGDPDFASGEASYLTNGGESGTLTLDPNGNFWGTVYLTMLASEICVSVSYLDINAQEISNSYECLQFPIITPVTIEGIQTTPASGCGASDGCASLVVYGGSPPYNIEWGNGMLSQFMELCGLSPGYYEVWVVDSNGCSASASILIEEDPGPGLTMNAYYDINANNMQEDGFMLQEPDVPNMSFTIVEAGITAFTDEFGEINLPDLPDGNYTLQFNDIGGEWNTVINPMMITVPGCYSVPLTNSNASAVALTAPFTNLGIIHCVNGYSPGLIINNIGSQPLDAVVTMLFDPLFTPVPIDGLPAFSVDSESQISWTITDLEVSSQSVLQCHFDSPGLEYLGNSYPFTIVFSQLDGDGNPLYSTSYTFNPVVSCGYDPNDLTATPTGYADPHFILAGDEIDFMIRFQNTGNAPAEDIVVEDILDPARFDLTSFIPIYASHQHTVLLEDDGTLRYTFDGIMLPDSVNNEPESHGMIIYRVKAREDLVFNDVLENTAYIYFDLNPAVVTNTTSHTIYDCSQLPGIESDLAACVGNDIVIDASDPYTETYTWTLDGAFLSSEPTIGWQADATGEFELGLEVSNPLCSSYSSILVDVSDVETPELFWDETWVYTPAVGTVTWTYNGMPVENVSVAEWNATAYLGDGLYVVVVTNAEGCSATASADVTVGINEPNGRPVLVYPNPITSQSQLLLPPGVWSGGIYDTSGRQVVALTSVQNRFSIGSSGLTPGMYQLFIFTSGASHTVPIVVQD